MDIHGNLGEQNYGALSCAAAAARGCAARPFATVLYRGARSLRGVGSTEGARRWAPLLEVAAGHARARAPSKRGE